MGGIAIVALAGLWSVSVFVVFVGIIGIVDEIYSNRRKKI